MAELWYSQPSLNFGAVSTHRFCFRGRKGDPGKLAIAKKLRVETTMTLNWITRRLSMGTKTHLSHLLYWSKREKRDTID